MAGALGGCSTRSVASDAWWDDQEGSMLQAELLAVPGSDCDSEASLSDNGSDAASGGNDVQGVGVVGASNLGLEMDNADAYGLNSREPDTRVGFDADVCVDLHTEKYPDVVGKSLDSQAKASSSVTTASALTSIVAAAAAAAASATAVTAAASCSHNAAASTSPAPSNPNLMNNSSCSILSSRSSLSPVSFLIQSHIGMLPPASPMSRPNSNDSGVEDAATTAQRLMQYVVHIRRGDGSPIGDEESAANGAEQDGKGRREREELELLLEQELLADHRHLQMQAKEVEHQQHRQQKRAALLMSEQEKHVRIFSFISEPRSPLTNPCSLSVIASTCSCFLPTLHWQTKSQVPSQPSTPQSNPANNRKLTVFQRCC